MLWIRKDLGTGKEGTSELLEIKRAEPDPTLYEIPKDYEVNPAVLPSQKGFGLVRPDRR